MRLARSIAAVAFIVALVATAPASATASELVSRSVPAADPIPVDPSGWKKFMLAVKSSLLGPAAQFAWQTEQLASKVIYADTYSTLNAALGIDGIQMGVDGHPIGFKYTNRGTGTYTDVVVDNLEQRYREQAIANSKRNVSFVPPSTKALKLVKLVGGVAGVISAYDIGASLVGAPLGNAVGGWFGFDANGAVCGAQGYDNDIQKWVFRSMSGQDCTDFDAYVEGFKANLDAEGALSITYSGTTLTYVRTTVFFRTYSDTSPASQPYGYCFSGYNPAYPVFLTYGSNPVVEVKSVGGAWVNVGRLARGTGDATYDCPTSNYTVPGGVAFGPGAGGQTTLRPEIRVRDTVTGAITNGTKPVTDLDRQNKCKVTNTDGTSQTGPLTLAYRESSGEFPLPVCPETPAGKTPDKVEIIQDNPGTTPDQTQTEQEVTPEFQEWSEDYPECKTGGCKLDLYRKVPTPVVSCFEIAEGCPDWFKDPNKLDNYECRYGVHIEPLAECNVYAGLFDPGRITSGAPWSDPTTGEWSGGQNAPRQADSAMTRPIQNPETFRACNFPNVFLDPIGAGVAGGQCLFEWAAIPRPTVADVAFNGVSDVWADKPPGAIVTAVENVTISGAATGCSINTTYKGTTQPIVDACGGFMGGLATFTRLATTAIAGVAVFMYVRRQIGGMVNYNLGQD